MQNPVKNPTICLFSDTVCDANGVSRFIQDLASSSEEGSLYVITSTNKSYCKKLDNIINIKPIFKTGMPYYKELDIAIPNYFELKKRATIINPDIVVISTPGPIGMMGLRIANRLKAKKVAIYHTDFPSYMYDNTKSRFIEKGTTKFMRYFYKQFERVYSRSNEYYSTLLNDIKVPKDRLFVLKAGIDTKSFHMKYKEEAFWQNYEIDVESIKLLYVGRLTKEKNFPFLLEIWDELREKSSKKIELICCGEGKILEKKEELKSRGIHLLGYKGGEELSKIYANSDIFLFPSVTDTLGQVVMEAQASGKPAIVSNIGGPKTIVRDGESGYCIEVEKNIWLQKIAELVDDEQKRVSMGKEGFNSMQGKSFEITYEDFKNLNMEILKNEGFMIQSKQIS
ncbi:MAG: glycosyltransferase [Campylobacterales bacterium]